MRVLITGGRGQLGRALQAVLAQDTVLAGDLPEMDITDLALLRRVIGEFRPERVIHAAALTDTGRCERDPALADKVNHQGSRNVAIACREAGVPLVCVSTNEVFDGQRATPYPEDAPVHPLNVYAASKAAGERAIQEEWANHYIVRTAWVYGAGGNHFVGKVLKQAESNPVLRYVTDEIATPTWTNDLAAAIAQLIQTEAYGIYHFTNAGQASRYDFAREILRLAGRSDVTVLPVTSADFTPTIRKPPYSVLANIRGAALGITLPPWEKSLAAFLTT